MQDPRDHRDTEPLAIWGFVLTFLLWPAGLVLSWLALRRVRATGNGGWGLAVAGTALSAVAGVTTVVAGVGLLMSSGLADAWADDARTRATVRDVVGDVESEVRRVRDETGTWPASIKDTALDVQDGEVRGVRVEAYREGDTLCVDGAADGLVVTRLDGDLLEGTTCAQKGVGTTLRAAASAEAAVADAATDDVVRAEVLARAEETAAASDRTTPPDLGLRRPPADIDLEACAVLQGNRAHLRDARVRQAVADAFAERVADLPDGALDDAAYALGGEHTLTFDADDTDATRAYLTSVLRAQYDCWRGGYVAPSGSPQEFPATWTEPLTQQAVEEDRARAHRVQDGTATPEDRAVTDADAARETAELDAVLDAWPW